MCQLRPNNCGCSSRSGLAQSPAHSMDSSSSHRDPAQLCFESVRTRRLIIASYWAVVLLAIPLWWKATSIERLSLPASRVYAQRSREVPIVLELLRASLLTDMTTSCHSLWQSLSIPQIRPKSGLLQVTSRLLCSWTRGLAVRWT